MKIELQYLVLQIIICLFTFGFAQDIPDWIMNVPSDDEYYWARI